MKSPSCHNAIVELRFAKDIASSEKEIRFEYFIKTCEKEKEPLKLLNAKINDRKVALQFHKESLNRLKKYDISLSNSDFNCELSTGDSKIENTLICKDLLIVASRELQGLTKSVQFHPNDDNRMEVRSKVYLDSEMVEKNTLTYSESEGTIIRHSDQVDEE